MACCAVLHLHVALKPLRVRRGALSSAAADPSGGSFDLKRGVVRDLFPQELLQP